MITRRKFVVGATMALAAVAIVGVLDPHTDMTVGEAIQSGRITEAEAIAYLDKTANI